MLASAGDDGNVLLWVPTDTPLHAIGEEHTEDKETWRIKHMCRTSTGAEIYDLAWSPDGVYFITGGVDNTARIFNAHTGESRYPVLIKILTVSQVPWCDRLRSTITTCKVLPGTLSMNLSQRSHQIDQCTFMP